MLDNKKKLNSILLYYIIASNFVNQFICLQTDDQILVIQDNESSVFNDPKPMIHLDQLCNDKNESLISEKNQLDKVSKLDKSFVHIDSDTNYQQNKHLLNMPKNIPFFLNKALTSNLMNKQIEHQKLNQPTSKVINHQDHFDLDQLGNGYNENDQKEKTSDSIYTQTEFVKDDSKEKCEKNLSIPITSPVENRKFSFETEMSGGNDLIMRVVNNSYKNDKFYSNENDSIQQHRSNDQTDYKTTINLEDEYFSIAKIPHFISNHQFTPTSQPKINQLIQQSKPKSNNQLNQNEVQIPVIENLKLMNKYLDYKLKSNSAKKLSKQIDKPTDLDDSEEDEQKTDEDLNQNIDDFENDQEQANSLDNNIQLNKINSNGLILSDNEKILNQLNQELNNNQDTNFDFEYSKELDKNLASKNLNEFNFDKEYGSLNQIYQQIQSQIQSHKQDQNIDKVINQYLKNNDKKQSQMQKQNNFKKFKTYYIQHLNKYPVNRNIPLHNLKYTPLNNLRKTRSQSKFRNQLNTDRRSLPGESLIGYPYLSSLNSLNYPPNSWYFRKQKAKIDDNYYRKLLWIRKQNFLNSLLNNAHKSSIPFKMINHELQPDSSDDLYSYSPITEIDLDDYDSDITVTPSAQSVTTPVNYPALMGFTNGINGYYTNAYKYYNMLPTMQPPNYGYNMMPTIAPTMAPTMTPMNMMQQMMMPPSIYDLYRNNLPMTKYQQDDYHKHHSEHHHDHYSHMPLIPIPPMPMSMHHPPTHVIRNYKKNDLKDMLWPLLFAVVLPLTFGALLLPLTLMFLVNLFMLLQILRNPNNDLTGNSVDDNAAAKIIKYKSGLLSLPSSVRTDASNSTTKTKSRSKRTTNKLKSITPLLKKKTNDSHLRFLTALIQFQTLLNQPRNEYLRRNKY